jgi:hypothetical protein
MVKLYSNCIYQLKKHDRYLVSEIHHVNCFLHFVGERRHVAQLPVRKDLSKPNIKHPLETMFNRGFAHIYDHLKGLFNIGGMGVWVHIGSVHFLWNHHAQIHRAQDRICVFFPLGCVKQNMQLVQCGAP